MSKGYFEALERLEHYLKNNLNLEEKEIRILTAVYKHLKIKDSSIRFLNGIEVPGFLHETLSH